MKSIHQLCAGTTKSSGSNFKKKLNGLAMAVISVSMYQAPPVSAELMLEEIIVTARKRAETAQDTPVVLTAFGRESLENNAVGSFDDLSTLVPNLNVSGSTNGVNPVITLRGISSVSALLNASTEQAVSINIDGVQFSNALAVHIGQFDMRQIEVLKGPQALYFGKNSPGGIIVVHTEDPTDELFTEFRLGYEESAESKFGHAIFSGPISDTVGARLAVSYTDTEGFLDNDAPGVVEDKGPNYDEWRARATLTWEPSDTVAVNTKVTYTEREGAGTTQWQLTECNPDLPLEGFAVYDDCRFNDTFAIVDPSADPIFDPALSQTGLWKNEPEHEHENLIVSAKIDWKINDEWSLASITGYYNLDQFRFENSIAAAVIAIGQIYEEESISQELRFTGNFDDWSIMLGAYVDDREFSADVEAYLGLVSVINFIAPSITTIDSDSFSVFAQASYAFNEQWELSAGGRYTEEDKEYVGKWTGDGLILRSDVAGVEFLVVEPAISYDNFSPEITLSYRPTNDALIFASYREGFKAGGFDNDNTNAGFSTSPLYVLVPGENSFDEELIDGYEVGFKTEWLDNRLRLNGAAFYYDYTDTQVTSLQIENNIPVTETLNAGESKTSGVEIDGIYLPAAVDGLMLNFSFSYLDAEWEDAVLPCSDWQIFEDPTGCDIDTTGDGDADATQLSGNALAFAPEYAVTFGASYETDLTESLGVRVNALGIWTDGQDATSYGEYDPRTSFDDYWLVNGSVSLYAQSDAWSVDLIGRNLTDEAVPTVFAGGSFSQVPMAAVGYGRNAPRSWLLQFTVRPGNW